jgi:hypothetical protein
MDQRYLKTKGITSMLIKVSDSPERYVNTDLVEVVTFGRNLRYRKGQETIPHNGAILDFRSGRTIPISDAAGRALIEFAEGNSAFIDSPEIPGQISIERATPVGGNAAPLKSKIAQFLRDEAPHGVMIMDLIMKFPGQDTDVPIALAELQEERVVFLIDDERYFHASHAPRRMHEPSEF